MRYPDVPFLLLWAALIAGQCLAASIYLDAPWYLVAFTAINVATFMLYGIDKLLAAMGFRRVPERTLHLVAFLFGSPGALAAMYAFRHKTRKTSFQFVLAVLVLVQVLAIVGAMYLFPQWFLAGKLPFGVN